MKIKNLLEPSIFGEEEAVLCKSNSILILDSFAGQRKR